MIGVAPTAQLVLLHRDTNIGEEELLVFLKVDLPVVCCSAHWNVVVPTVAKGISVLGPFTNFSSRGNLQLVFSISLEQNELHC